MISLQNESGETYGNSNLDNQADFTGSYGTAATPIVFSSNQVSTTIVQGLTATKSANKEYWVNGPLLYTIVVRNSSGDKYTNGVLTDKLDTSLVAFDTEYSVQIDAAKTSDFTYTDGTLSVNLPGIEDGGEVTVTFQITQI